MAITQPILAAAQAQKSPTDTYWWQQNSRRCDTPTPKPGDQCPACHQGILAYDSLFLLTCNKCRQVAESGAFT